MKDRWTEIEFYLFIKNLLKEFDSDVNILDLIDAICLLSKANSLVIKKYIRQIRDEHGIIIVPPEELMSFARSTGISYRALYKVSGIATSTQQRYKHSTTYANMNYKTGADFIDIDRFMKCVRRIKGV